MKTHSHHKSGFSLVEVTLALGVAAFCLLAIFGLLPVGLNSNQNSIEQTAAASMARSIVADLRATPKTSGTSSPYYKLSFPPSNGSVTQHTIWLGDGGAISCPVDNAANPGYNPTPRYRAYLTLTAPSTTRSTTMARLLITWTALADNTINAEPKNFSGSYEVVTALDRN